jgi:ferritin-like metal-binding protein YciE
MGHTHAAKVLQQMLKEDKATDRKLSDSLTLASMSVRRLGTSGWRADSQ